MTPLRRGDAECGAHACHIEAEQFRRDDRTAKHTGDAGRVEPQLLRRELIACILKTPLDFESLGDCGDDFTAAPAVQFGQRKRDRHGRRDRMRRRTPHRFEVEHVRSHRVDVGRLHDRGFKAVAPYACLRRAAEPLGMLNCESYGCLATARERDGDTVLNRFFHARDALVAERFVARGMNDRAEIVRQAHPEIPLECAVSRAAISDL